MSQTMKHTPPTRPQCGLLSDVTWECVERAIRAWTHYSYRGVMLPAMGSTTCSELREELTAITTELGRLSDFNIALLDALCRLENACNSLAATRPQEAYDAMIFGGQEPELEELDEARREARAVLAKAEGRS